MLLCAFGRRPLRAGFFGSVASSAGFSCTSFSFTCFSFAVFSFTGFSSAGAASFFALVLLVIGFLAGFAGFSSAGFSSIFSCRCLFLHRLGLSFFLYMLNGHSAFHYSNS